MASSDGLSDKALSFDLFVRVLYLRHPESPWVVKKYIVRVGSDEPTVAKEINPIHPATVEEW